MDDEQADPGEEAIRAMPRDATEVLRKGSCLPVEVVQSVIGKMIQSFHPAEHRPVLLRSAEQ